MVVSLAGSPARRADRDLDEQLAGSGAVVALAPTAGGPAGEPGSGTRLLRLLLHRLGLADDRWELGREPHGRPVLQLRGGARRGGRAGGPGCSISHSGGLVAVCVAEGGAVGIDVQAVPDGPARRWTRVADRWLHPAEAIALARRAAVDPTGARADFTTVWAIREARCKATGRGLAGLATADPVRLRPATSGAGTGPSGGRLGGAWWRTLAAPPGFALAVARADAQGRALLERSVTVWTDLGAVPADPPEVRP